MSSEVQELTEIQLELAELWIDAFPGSPIPNVPRHVRISQWIWRRLWSGTRI